MDWLHLFSPSGAPEWALGLLWLVLALFMATADALAPTSDFRVAAWLVLFFLGVLGTFWLLLGLLSATIASAMLFGAYLGPYGAVWQAWMAWKGVTNVFPVSLYPFGISLNESQWYAMLGLGAFLFLAGLIGALLYGL